MVTYAVFLITSASEITCKILGYFTYNFWRIYLPHLADEKAGDIVFGWDPPRTRRGQQTGRDWAIYGTQEIPRMCLSMYVPFTYIERANPFPLPLGKN